MTTIRSNLKQARRFKYRTLLKIHRNTNSQLYSAPKQIVERLKICLPHRHTPYTDCMTRCTCNQKPPEFRSLKWKPEFKKTGTQYAKKQNLQCNLATLYSRVESRNTQMRKRQNTSLTASAKAHTRNTQRGPRVPTRQTQDSAGTPSFCCIGKNF